MATKLPAFQFYPGDWMKDPALRSCSPGARGVWIDLLCLMFESGRRGYLQTRDGTPYSEEQLARMTGCSAAEISKHLAELEAADVFSKTKSGVIFSRRIKRDEEKRADQRHRQHDYRNRNKTKENSDAPDTQDVTPVSKGSSSSTSTSTSSKKQNPARAVKTQAADERHAAFKEVTREYWKSKNPNIDMPWDGAEGKQLGMFLRAAPHITLEQYRTFLRNRFCSEVNHGTRPSQWICQVTIFAEGPIDRFGKPMKGANGNAASGPSPTKQRIDNNVAAIAAAAKRRGLCAVDPAHFANSSTVPDAGFERINGGVSPGLREAGSQAFAFDGEGSLGTSPPQPGPEVLSPAR